jgi:hypothetical protein
MVMPNSIDAMCVPATLLKLLEFPAFLSELSPQTPRMFMRKCSRAVESFATTVPVEGRAGGPPLLFAEGYGCFDAGPTGAFTVTTDTTVTLQSHS